jgi:predicted RNase H-like HicB family nuclease
MDSAEDRARFIVAIHHTPQGCFAQVVNLPGCFARGANEVEALENVRGAIRAFVAITQLLRHEKPRVSLEISA